MEDENYRNFVMSRLNTQLDKKLSSDRESIEDVVGQHLPLRYVADVIHAGPINRSFYSIANIQTHIQGHSGHAGYDSTGTGAHIQEQQPGGCG